MSITQTTKRKLMFLYSSILSIIFSNRVLAEIAQPEYGIMQPMYGVVVKYGMQPLYGVPPVPQTFWQRLLFLLTRPLVLVGLLIFLSIGIFVVLKYKKGKNVKKPKKSRRKRPE